jgi:response regulator RpfG family c-di-GMP phosphodiesterase
MDVQMPEMDGFEATNAIRASGPPGDQIPIIALTAHALQGDKERCLEAGMNDYLPKPINPTEVFDTIDKWFSKQQKRQAMDRDLESAKEHLDEDDPIDVHQALPLFGDDEVFFLELLEEFVERCPGIAAEMQAAIQARDFEALERTSHNLKGLASNFHARQLAEISKQMEWKAKAATDSGLDELPPRILVEIDRLKAFYEKLAGKTATPENE